MADSRPLLLEVEHLCKWFPLKRTAGDVLQRKEKRYLKAVNDVSFQLFKGENLGLVGESGCGKSTLARTILRLYEPTSGTILLNGRDIHGLNTAQINRAGIARTFQNIRLFQNLSVEENITTDRKSVV